MLVPARAGEREAARVQAEHVDYASVFAAQPTAYLVMTPDLVVVEANPAYLAVVGRTRDSVVGRPVFEAFPPAADALDDSGVSFIQRSFERARDTGRPDSMPVQKYDIPDPETGGYTERYWSLISVPVLDETGRTVLVMQRTEDITDYLRDRYDGPGDLAQTERWRQRVVEVEGDLYRRARELEAARAAEATATRRVAALADVALQLSQAQTLHELTAVVVERGLTALGADGGALAVRDETGELTAAVSPGLGERSQEVYGRLPLDGPLPASVTARTGERVVLADEDAVLAYAPEMAEVVEHTGCRAWVVLPLAIGDTLLGSLSVGWAQGHAFTSADLEVLDALAAQCAHGLLRIQSREAERAVAAAAQRMSETLQRSLLTEPPQPDHLRIAVRYRPAASEAQVGGDWHDAFLTSQGTTCLVIGDVAGHDRDAAAAMGQLRNMLRGIGYVLGEPPAAVLSSFDRALRDLAVGSLATALLATVEDSDVAPGARRLTWSSAGHPPPLLLEPGGRARLLHRDADLLLGLDPDTERVDHEVLLVPGAVVLLYTDGLIERRGAGIDEGMCWLEQVGAELSDLGVEELCDALLARIGEGVEDDVALLALQVAPG